ncbi:MAG: DUF3703 domain-containing protein [Burkholderiaceae bacterium]
MSQFGRRIRPHVDTELGAATQAERLGQQQRAFAHLERAHVLGQASTVQHVRVHWAMLLWGIRQRRPRECAGQLPRIVGAASKTAFGLVPHGNTGGANVSPFKPMPIAPELEARIRQARRRQA